MGSAYGAVFAALYDAAFARAERKGLRAMRKDLLGQCAGIVLEVGAGTGFNVGHYDRGLTRLVLTEPDPHMAAKLRAAVARLRLAAEVIEAPAESLPFPDASFDTVVSTRCSARCPVQMRSSAKCGGCSSPAVDSCSSSMSARIADDWSVGRIAFAGHGV
ncbi:MAG TPA: methyltransferase domain-containing protein [Candidatus Dormibacteraeota bacterium]